MRTALVTGGARRIGAAICRALAADGWRVVIHCNRSRGEAAALAGEIGAAGVVTADLTDWGAVEGLVPDAVAAAGPLTLLVNNASLFENDALDSMSEGSFARNVAVNLRAPTQLCRAFARQLPDGAEGCIVNLLDNKLFAINADFLSYTLAKVALEGLTRALALKLAPSIRVAGIAPGITLISGRQTQESFEKAWRMTPLGRSSTPDDIVAALRFVVATPSFTGRTVILDGGQSLAGLPRDVAYLVER